MKRENHLKLTLVVFSYVLGFPFFISGLPVGSPLIKCGCFFCLVLDKIGKLCNNTHIRIDDVSILSSAVHMDEWTNMEDI